MSWLVKTFASPIGQKVLTALTGLGLVGFLVMHLLGNLNLYRGEEAINEYAHLLHAIPGFPLIEAGLVLCFLAHIALVFNLTRLNRAARGQDYSVKASKQRGTLGRALVSTYMGVSGLVVLIFVIVHVADMRMAREEIFGPVAPLFRFKQDDEAVAAANATEYGLAAYLYTRDISRAWRTAEALEYGMVGLNTGLISNEVAPFGGIKQSGVGREGSRHGIEEYLEIKYLCLQM